jgi:hypothetical protein
MQRIVHTNHGEPAEVLTLEAFSDAPALVSGAVSSQFEPAAVRDADVAEALELARNFPSLFPVAGRYQASDYLGALEHTYRRGSTGMVLLAF